ncbi:hypothetical protein J1N35_034535 [Gossypium stocksii]|uniref:Uncharacterized protein n=1 Tax=Gossypium stocksii TaxID=47602 RepID=A0A9D3ZQT0_9ROSI|nr:hypothetical protein J1N35_034535 [Gossypium stocksii]
MEDSLQWCHDIHPPKKTLKLNTARGITISTSGYCDTAFVKGTNLDKKCHITKIRLVEIGLMNRE